MPTRRSIILRHPSRPSRIAGTSLLLILVLHAAAARAAARLALPGTVEQYARLEFDVPLRKNHANPYDPDEVKLDAVFICPSGVRRTVPAFFFQAYDPLFNLPRHQSAWRVRFTPREVGKYGVRLRLAEKEKPERMLARGSFEVRPSRRPGFVWRSRPPSPYFALSTGAAFFPIGLNYCWGDRQNPARYLRELDRLAGEGVNCVRVWTCPWWLPIESSRFGKRKRTIGWYDQGACALLDAILERCEKNGIRVILCIEQFGNFEPAGGHVGHWPQNPYNKRMGGPCAGTSDFFRGASAREFFKRKLRYLIGRFGHSTALMAWELFNEVELVRFEKGDFRANEPMVAEWHREMTEYLRRHDPYAHLVCTSADEALQRRLLLAGAIDFLQFHLYDRPDYAAAVADVIGSHRNRYGAPLLISEYGEIKKDPRNVSLRRGMWASVAAGAAGGGLYWWKALKGKQGPFHPPLAHFLKGIDWQAQRFRPARATDLDVSGNEGPGKFTDLVVPTTLEYGNEVKGGVTCQVRRDGTLSPLGKLPKFLQGTGKPKIQQPLLFDVEFPQDGAIGLKVNIVSDHAVIDFYVDGRRNARKELITGPNNKEAKRSKWFKQWMTYQDTYDREYVFPVPAGRHKIRIANSGRDWAQIEYVRFVGYKRADRPKVGVTAVVGQSAALAYVYSLDHAWEAVNEGRAPHQRRPVQFTLHGLPDGAYLVQHWRPATGKIADSHRATSRRGKLLLRDVNVLEDVALKILPQ